MTRSPFPITKTIGLVQGRRAGPQLKPEGADELSARTAGRGGQCGNPGRGRDEASDLLIRARKALDRTFEQVCTLADERHPTRPPSFRDVSTRSPTSTTPTTCGSGCPLDGAL